MPTDLHMSELIGELELTISLEHTMLWLLFVFYSWLFYRIFKYLQLDELFFFLQVVLPTFILERRSLLEMYADFFAHPDLFVRYLTLKQEHSLFSYWLWPLWAATSWQFGRILLEFWFKLQNQSCQSNFYLQNNQAPIKLPCIQGPCLYFTLPVLFSLSVALVTRRIPRRGWYRW